MKWIKRIIIGLLALVLVIVVAGYMWLRSSKPEYTGNLSVPGLKEQVEVYFDDYGVPHIYAKNNHDLYLAFGYIHAQDRLFQMELLRRAGGGTLAEIIGRPMLKVDRMFRTLGLTEYAEESAAYFETQKGTPMYNDAMAYLEGVNSFIQHGKTPPEYSIIGIEKKTFTVRDIYLITGAMSFSFSQAQKTEPVVDYISKELGEDYLKDIALWHDSTETYMRSNIGVSRKDSLSKPYKSPRNNAPVQIGSTRSDALLDFATAMSNLETLMPFAPLEGSNSWVISGSKTKNKDVLFCNDTHIGYLLPQTWYEAHLHSPNFEIYGHFMGGVPFALVGRNRNISWGLTMLLNDDMDFYSEKINPDNNNQVWVNDHWEDLKTIAHTIKIKGESDTTIQVRITRHGPVVNDAFEGIKNENPISMFWTYTALPNRTVDAFYGFNHSAGMSEFKTHVDKIHAPGLNINYGDLSGNVAWWACASLIKRPSHVNSWTMLDGASGRDEAQGYYSFEYNPRCINPEWGYIYSANDWPQYLSTPNDSVTQVWYPGYYKPQDRADRIRQLIEEKNDWDIESIQSVMNDDVNTEYVELMKIWYGELRSNPLFKDSTYLKQFTEVFDWDGTHSPNNPSPTFFNAMLYFVMRNAMQDELGPERFKLFLETHQAQRAQNVLIASKKSRWWDVKDTDSTETRSDIIFKSYCETIDLLTEKFGDNPKVWTWRKACQLELKHPLGEVAVFRPIFNIGPNPVYGGNETILQSGFKLDSAAEYKVYFGSQMRIIVDFANVDSSLNITPSGNSGHVLSKHYADQAELYRNRKFRTQWMDRNKIQTFESLILNPAP